MSGKKGGIISSVGNATGLTAVTQAVYNPLADIAGKGQERDRKRAKDETRRQEGLQAEAEAAVANQNTIAEQTEAQRKKRSAQRVARLSQSGRAGTILTSPLGDATGGSATGKTLLGV